MKTMRMTVLAMTVWGLAGILAAAEEGQEGRKGEQAAAIRQEVQQFHQEKKAEREAMREQIRAGNQALRETLKQQETAQAIAGLRTACEQNYQTRTALHEKQQAERVAFAKELAAKYELPEERLQERLERMTGNHEQATAHFATQHQENLAFLDGLDPTMEKKAFAEAVKAQLQTQHEENKTFVQGLRPQK